MPTDNHTGASSTGRNGADSRKQAVSIRMSRSDLRHVKRLAERLGARDSDIIRFAIKLMLARLSPLQDPSVRGRSLVPIFLESGPDLMRHFELDAGKLSSIINEGVEPERCVESDDIQLIAMSAIQRSYVKLQVASFRRVQGTEAIGQSTGHSSHTGFPNGSLNGQGAVGEDPLDHSLRDYLYGKYLFARSSNATPSEGDNP
jgi:hypothetical protein